MVLSVLFHNPGNQGDPKIVTQSRCKNKYLNNDKNAYSYKKIKIDSFSYAYFYICVEIS